MASSEPKAAASTFKEFISLKKISEDAFETYYYPEKMGNTAAIAYGGCAIAVALNAAFQTLPTTAAFHLYSTTGYFLGPSLTDRKLICSVKRVRDTRTFATRIIEVSQETDVYKSTRKVLITMADFQVAEPASMFEYSAQPLRKYRPVEQQMYAEDYYASRVAAGWISEKAVDAWRHSFGLMRRFFDGKPCAEGIFAQNLMGIAKGVATTQDDVPFLQKTSADYFRLRERLSTEAEHMTATNFAMDAAIAFMPLSHNHQFLEDTAAVSTLDFALRIFTNHVDMNEWHLREMTTIAGGAGRTYSESRLWDMKGNMVAAMTQQSIMRPAKQPAAKI